MKTGNPALRFLMLNLSDGFYQVAELEDNGKTSRHAARIDIVTGSGKMGQTYLHWQGSRLYELPVSYMAETDTWMNSPGYKDGEVNFWRPVGSRCLECHATYFETWSDHKNSYSKENFVLGISCERCHGPGGQHVDYHQSHPEEIQSRYVLHPGDLKPARQIEICAQCHSGHGTAVKPAFSFRPGKPLGQFIELESHDELNQIGVHSNNQVARLSKSQCFKQSDTMTCATCHDPHQFERGNVELFSQRCMQCHAPDHCGMAPQLGDRISTNCIDCHMPKRRDKGTPLMSSGGTANPLMREHDIAIYPEDAERVSSKWQN